MSCNCYIVPLDVLKRFSNDPELQEEIRKNFAFTLAVSQHIRPLREERAKLEQSIAGSELFPRLPIPYPFPRPKICKLPPSLVDNCNHTTSQPGTPVPNPSTSADATVKRACNEAEAVAKFYCEVFGRDSIDNAHMTLLSSVHYSVRFNNAFWDGTHMTYGDGDGVVFVDFTLGNDVIGHELTHGVTQHSAGFAYANEPGGLNESMSDVFGSMFRQWQANQDVNHADWLIGHDIMGPHSTAAGYTCLRDMSNPAAAHCLAPQPTNFSQYHAGMDPHYSSGIPNFAFYKAAKAYGGHSWGNVGHVWYRALTGFPPSPNMLMSQFAARTRALSHSMFPADAALQNAINAAWTAVGL